MSSSEPVEGLGRAVSRRVEELLFGSFADWKRFFQDRLKTELPALARDWDAAQEVFQRRHVIVHSVGRASKRYVSAVGKTDPGKGVAEGDDLNCNDGYLRAALDELLVLGTLLVCAVAMKFDDSPEGPSCLDQLQEMSYNALVDEQWPVAEALCAWGECNAPVMSDKILFRVNRLIASWRLNGRERIRTEVSDWDVSALDTRYKFAKACLLDERDDAFEHLGTLSHQGAVTRSNLLEWPLLGELRDDPRFASFLEEASSTTGTALVMSRGSSVFHHSECARASGSAVVVSAGEIAARGATPCKSCRPAVPEAS